MATKLYETQVYSIKKFGAGGEGELVSGQITNVRAPAQAEPGTPVKIYFTVELFDGPIYGHDEYQFVVDADTGEALKGNYTFGFGKYTRDEDITIIMPNKDLRFRIELWDEVPAQYAGVEIEKIV